MNGETFAPETLVAALNRAGVRYVIVGGLAVGAHGVVRATRDVDLVAAPDGSLAHLRKMKRASDRPRDRVDLAELDELHGPEEA